MFVGVLGVRLHLAGVGSLKEKRRIVLQVKERVRSRFHCAAAEVGDLDSWQAATLGFSVVSNEHAAANSALDKIAGFVESMGVARVMSHSIEIISVTEG